MQEFSATDAAFEGFRVARERPVAILSWAAVALLAEVIYDWLIFPLGGDTTAQLQAAMLQKPVDVAKVSHLVAALGPAVAASLAFLMVFYSILFAAAFRVVLRPQSTGIPVRLGLQEVRQMIVLAITLTVLVLGIMGVAFIGAVLTGLAARVNPALAGVFATLTYLATFAGTIVVPIRLSLAGPQTFAEERLRPFASWELTRRKFWPIAGTYLLATVFALIVAILGMLVIGGVVAATGVQPADVVKPPTGVAAYFAPLRVLYLVAVAFLSALAWAILLCPAAVIYRQIHEQPA